MVFPGVETVWLDGGREVQDLSVVTRYASDRLNIYKSYLPKGLTEFSLTILQEMSRKAWKTADDSIEGGTSRDLKFAKLVLQKLRNARSDWAIIIVGKNHASKNPGCMRASLEKRGVDCEVSELRSAGG